ncbi:MAG: alanine racemase [Candidatus Marinimicrobia bacterium]|nr:alanine racemase [Candidatus Neomarinimicrobiota bacterium]
MIIILQPLAEINLENLNHNYFIIQNEVGDSKVMGVIKADAYGHGAVEIATSLSATKIHGFCVALVKEIIELREHGITKPILLLGKFFPIHLELFNANTICTINAFEDIDVIQNYFVKTGNKISAHVKFDTGMGRMGFHYSQAEDVLAKIKQSSGILLEGIYSHFSTAEEVDSTFMELQRSQFDEVIQVSKTQFQNLTYHISNSAGIFTDSQNHYDMVRPGITLYGVTPFGKAHDKLQPIMHFKAPVVLKKKILNGESVGYNQTFFAEKDFEMAVIQAGYGDGIPMELSNSGSVVWNEKKLPIIGKVSMDLITVDCTNIDINVGDHVTLWGSVNHRIEWLSKEVNKNPYTFLTGVTKRVKREYINA